MSGQATSRSKGNVRAHPLAIVIGLVLFLTGCSGEPTPATPAEPPTTSPIASAPVGSTSTLAPSSTSTRATTTTEGGSVDQEGASATWDAFWVAWGEVRQSEDLDRRPLDEVAEAAVVDGAIALFERQRQTSGPVETEVATHPNITMTSDSEALIEDCVLLRPSFTDHTGVWYEADLRRDGSAWVVADLRIRSTQGCVPEAMASAAIGAYEAYYAAVAEFWDPPDPHHPLVAETMTDPRLSNIQALLEEHETRGVAFRSDPVTHPEIVEVQSANELVILDCYEPNVADGVFDLASGARLPDEPAVREGQRNLRSAIMVLVDGKWKASDYQGQVDYEGEFAPTERGLPSV